MKLQMDNEEQQKLTDLQRNNERALYELKKQINRALVEKGQDEL